MARSAFQAYITNPDDGGVLDGAQLSVTYEAGGTATIYEQQVGGAEKDNPFTIGTDGKAVFYAEPGLYRITATQGGITSEFRNYRIGVFSNELNDITSLSSLNTAALVDGQQFYRGEFWPDTGVGAVNIKWDANEPVANHNGGTIIDPAKISELDTVNKTFGTYFTPDTVSGNTGCFVVVNENTLHHIDVMWFGAGEFIDCIVPFEQADLAAGSASSAPITIPAGVFRISRPWEISRSNFKLSGAGSGSLLLGAGITVIRASSSMDSIINFVEPTSGGRHGRFVSDIRIDAQDPEVVQNGISVGPKNSSGILTDVLIYNTVVGVVMGESCFGWRFNRANCVIQKIGYDLRNKNHNTVFNDCVFLSVSGTTPEIGVRVGTDEACSSVDFYGCDFEVVDPSVGQLVLIDVRGFEVSGCYFEGRGTSRLIVAGAADGTSEARGGKISGSWFQGNNLAEFAVLINSVDGVAVENNAFSGIVDWAIQAFSSASNQIRNFRQSGNDFEPGKGISTASLEALYSTTLSQNTSITLDLGASSSFSLTTPTDFVNPIVFSVSELEPERLLTLYVDNTASGQNDFSFDAASFYSVSDQALLSGETMACTFSYSPALALFVETSRIVI